MVDSVKNIKDVLDPEEYADVLEKEWKTAELPSEDELAQEKSESPKARNNPNSRKNLIQYRKDKPKEVKKKIIDALSYTQHEEDVNPADILQGEVDFEMINKLLPANDILANRAEQELYWQNIRLFIKDFDIADLAASDVDGIITLAVNKILIYRLLKASRRSDKMLLEAMPSIEKIKKQDEQIKTGLASRRIDRVDVKQKKGFSIVDLAAQLDEDSARELEARIKKMEQEHDEFVKRKETVKDGSQ